MAQFASVWAVKTGSSNMEGVTVPVKLRSGAEKQVKLSKFLYATERKDGSKAFYYLPEKTED